MLKLKLQYVGHLMWPIDSLEKTLMLERLKAGGEGDNRRLNGWMASLTGWIWVWASSGSWWWTGKPGSPWGHKESDMTELSWTELKARRLNVRMISAQVGTVRSCFDLQTLFHTNGNASENIERECQNGVTKLHNKITLFLDQKWNWNRKHLARLRLQTHWGRKFETQNLCLWWSDSN